MTRTHDKQAAGTSKLVRDLPGDKQRNFAIAARQAKLTSKEEMVLRMRLKGGVAAPADQKLEYRGQSNDLTRRRLAQMERRNLDTIRRMAKEKDASRQRPTLVHPDLS